MVRKGFKPEQIINKLREAEVLLKPGRHGRRSQPEAGHHRADLLPLAEREYGGMRIEQARNTQRRSPEASPEESRPVADIITLATRVWQIRLSPDNSLAPGKRLTGESQESGEDLEKRGLEGA